MLAEHPDILARLREEILGTLGSTGKVSPEKLREMKYLRAVLNGEPFSTFQHPSLLIYHRDTEVVSKRVRLIGFPNSCDQAEKRVAVHGTSDALRKVLSGQHLTGESQYTFQVVRRSTICLG